MTARTCLLVGGLLLGAAAIAAAQEIPVPADVPEPRLVREILFSIEEPPPPPEDSGEDELATATAALVDPADLVVRRPTHGDVLSDWGYIVAPNRFLLRNFKPALTTEPVNYGLDGLHLHRKVGDLPERPHFLFSTEVGFFSEALGVQVSDGDLLSDGGRIVMTNAQLLRNFRPMPPVPPVGLDGFCVMDIFQPIDTNAPPEIWFTTEVGFFDERLGVQITDGDLLSTTGRIVAKNRWLMRNFHPAPPPNGAPPPPHYGLDAVFVPKFNPRLQATSLGPPEIWFSTEIGWYDTVLKRQITHGDLLSSEGRVIRTNWQLMRKLLPPPPTATSTEPAPVKNFGLDAVCVRLRPADFDLDGSVDARDWGHFAGCFNGSGRPITNPCVDADLDRDNDVDGGDFAAFVEEYTGPLSDE